MTPQSRVVALVPAYNPRSADLVVTLQSLHAQTAPLDICLIDDGSTPPLEIPAALPANTCLIRLPRNGGITAALKAGVKFARERGYEFICRLDVGDIAYPDRARKQLAHLDAHPEIDLAGGFARIVAEDGQTLFFHGVDGGSDAVKAYLWKNAPFRHSSFFIRTRALVDCGDYDMAFDGAEDYELLLRMAKRGRLDCVPDTVIDYLADPAGISEVRRFRQLRLRLRAQLRHADMRQPGWWGGVVRTLLIMSMPRGLARQATLLTWGLRSRRRRASAVSDRVVTKAQARSL